MTRRGRLGLSWIWLVPLVALLVGVLLAVRTLADRADITIEFHTAEGIEAGRTEVRYKEVVIGRVSGVELSADASRCS